MTRTAAVVMACQLHETGEWSYSRISAHLATLGVTVNYKTVHRWVDPDYDQAVREANRPHGRRYRRNLRGSRPRIADADAVVSRIRELDTAGLDTHGIRIVVKVDMDLQVSAKSVFHVIETGALPVHLGRIVKNRLAAKA